MRILHLEDDGPLRDILRIALTAASRKLDMKQCTSSDEAMTYAIANLKDIDLYILDIRVPGSMNGVEFAEKLRELGATGRIVITSAYGRPSKEKLTALEAEWMPKPWHILDAPQKLLSMSKEAV